MRYVTLAFPALDEPHTLRLAGPGCCVLTFCCCSIHFVSTGQSTASISRSPARSIFLLALFSDLHI